MRIVFLLMMSYSFALIKSNCNDTKAELTKAKCHHGYLLIGYPVKNLDSTCLKNFSGALLRNKCIIQMNEYFIDVIPDFESKNSFDSAYRKDVQFDLTGGIAITKFDKRFTGGDVSVLLNDTTLKKSSKELIPRTTINTKLYLNKNASPQAFVYRIFEFEGSYVNKKVKNTSRIQGLLEGITNLVHDNIKTDTLDIYFFNSFIYLKEISAHEFKSNSFIAID